MPTTSANPRRASALAPKSHRLDAHHLSKPKKNNQQEHPLRTQTQLEPTQIQRTFTLEYPSVLIWKKSEGGRLRVTKPATQGQPAEVLRKVEADYRQFLQTIDDGARDKDRGSKISISALLV